MLTERHFLPNGETDATMAKEKEVEENARGRRETELAAEPPHVSTWSVTKAMPPKEGPSRFTLYKEGI